MKDSKIVNSKLHESAEIGENSTIVNLEAGLNLVVGTNTTIRNSHFGSNLIIGNNVRIIGSKLGNNGSITDGSSISNLTTGNFNKIYERATLNSVTLGDYTYIGSDTQINNTKFGKFCSIAQDVKIGLGTHPSHTFVSTHPVFYSKLKQSITTFVDDDHFNEFENVEIGNDVWIGANAIVKGGVKIGDGVIVGGGAVVTKDVLPYSIVGGVPAKHIKFRFTESQIKRLMDIKWWNKPDEWIKENYRSFHDIAEFLKKI